MALSAAQIAGYARAAGFSGDAVTTAVAVALAESSGNPNAVGDRALTNSTWGPSVGLWQIRSLKADRGTGRPRDELRLKDPAFNAKAAYTISGGGRNWSPWTVYKTGAYRLFTARAASASTAAGPTPEDGMLWGPGGVLVPEVIPEGIEAIPNAVGMLAKAGAWMSSRDNWLRVSQALVGGVIIVIGLAIMARPLTQSVAGEVAKVVAPTARLGKAAKAAAGKGA